MHELVQKLCFTPASFFGMDFALQEGSKAYNLFDPNSSFEVTNSDSLYEGHRLWGEIIDTGKDHL